MADPIEERDVEKFLQLLEEPRIIEKIRDKMRANLNFSIDLNLLVGDEVFQRELKRCIENYCGKKKDEGINEISG